MKIDKKIIKELTDYLNEFNLTEIEYTDKDTKIKVSKTTSPSTINQTSSVQIPKSINNENLTKSSSGKKITSPIIGTAYHAPEPAGVACKPKC